MVVVVVVGGSGGTGGTGGTGSSVALPSDNTHHSSGGGSKPPTVLWFSEGTQGRSASPPDAVAVAAGATLKFQGNDSHSKHREM